VLLVADCTGPLFIDYARSPTNREPAEPSYHLYLFSNDSFIIVRITSFFSKQLLTQSAVVKLCILLLPVLHAISVAHGTSDFNIVRIFAE
jgi:hypothetical protein